MNKYLICGVFLSCGGLASAATVKCVAFNPSVACQYENPGMSPIFSASCNGVAVKGLGYCSTQQGSNNSTSVVLNKSPGQYCWCKMISPAVSYWVYLESAMSEVQCWNTCSIDCAMHLGDRTNSYRSAMFNNIDK